MKEWLYVYYTFGLVGVGVPDKACGVWFLLGFQTCRKGSFFFLFCFVLIFVHVHTFYQTKVHKQQIHKVTVTVWLERLHWPT